MTVRETIITLNVQSEQSLKFETINYFNRLLQELCEYKKQERGEEHDEDFGFIVQS